jgi:hypothetical protein
MKNGLLGFATSFVGLLIGCIATVLISHRYSLNGLWQGLVGILLGGLGAYLPAWIWSKIANR